MSAAEGFALSCAAAGGFLLGLGALLAALDFRAAVDWAAGAPGEERLAPAPRWRLALAAALGCAFLFRALWPLWPARLFGVWYWPVLIGPETALAHCMRSALLGALFYAAAFDPARSRPPRGRRAGEGADAAAPVPPLPGRVLRAAAAGLLSGLAAGAAGLGAHRLLFVGDALRRLELGFAGGALIWGAAPAFLVSLALLAALAGVPAGWNAPASDEGVPGDGAPGGAALAGDGSSPLAGGGGASGGALPESSGPRWSRLAWGAALAALWVAPGELAESALRSGWDYGRQGLAEAAGVPGSSEAPSLSVVVLADREGGPGMQRRESLLAAGGVDASAESLERIEEYLERRRNRTLFLREALRALRRGWELNWEADKRLDAAMLDAGERFPPDFEGFLAGIRAAPATVDNYGRLETMGRRAWELKIGSVKAAQKTFEGFSAAYARFGDLETSNAWLERVRGLWPLYDDNVHVEPVQESHDGRISGSVSFNGLPARTVRVGLFTLPSTMTAVSAGEGLVASAFPDENGRFRFADLAPGRYYLALQGDTLALGDEGLEFRNAPGVLRLDVIQMEAELLPIEIERAGPSRPFFLEESRPELTDAPELPPRVERPGGARGPVRR